MKNRTKRYHWIALLPTFSFLLLLSNIDVRAQHWKETGPLSVVPYFLNAEVGFTYNIVLLNAYYKGQYNSLPNFNNVPSNLERTTDGGTTWTSIPFFDNIGCSVTQLCFVSLQHGYASTISGPLSPSGIYETMDQGLNWKKITPGNTWYGGVYAAYSNVFAAEISNLDTIITGNQILFSRNDGQTWDSITQAGSLQFDRPRGFELGFQLIYGNRDSLVATPYIDSNHNSYLVYSTDLGGSWQSSLLDSNYYWWMISLHISPHSCTIIRQFLDSQDSASQEEQGINLDTRSFLEASPPYTQWQASLMNNEVGTWISGNSCALYLSNARGPGPYSVSGPLLRSTNGGLSWTTEINSVPAPDMTEIDDGDWPNISVVGYGAVVCAERVDGTGGLWKTTDGGDGALSASALAPRNDFGHGSFASGNDTLVVSQCTPSSMTVYYQNLACAIAKLDSISISGLASNEYSLTSTNHNDCLSLPDTTYVTLTPIAPGTYPITVNAHFIDDEYNTIDTTLNVVLMVKAGIPLNLHFKTSTSTAHAGDTIDIPVYLSGNDTLGATSILLPFGLDTNVLRPIGFYSAISGLMTDSLIYENGEEIVPLQDSELTINGDTIIGNLRCIVYLADTLATSITLQNASLNSATAPCAALSLTTDSVNVLIIGCGDQTLLQFMKTGKIPLAIQSITPNPASNDIDVLFRDDLRQPISYELIDALGSTRQRGITQERNVSLDASSLSPGIYFFRASSTDGIAVVQKVAIER